MIVDVIQGLLSRSVASIKLNIELSQGLTLFNQSRLHIIKHLHFYSIAQYLLLFEEENNDLTCPNAATATADAKNPAAYLTISS